jgi:hypothetical protein
MKDKRSREQRKHNEVTSNVTRDVTRKVTRKTQRGYSTEVEVEPEPEKTLCCARRFVA